MPIYLDHNATTPILPEVVDAMLPYLREHFGNPSSGHVYGRRAHEAVERARGQVAELLGCDDDEVLFTSGGTEANNLAIRGVVEARGDRRHVVTTAIEHPATERPCAWLERHGMRLTRIGVDVDGRARVEEARAAIDAATALVTVMHSNNETGVLQPIADFAELAHAVGAVLHTDAAQSAGKVPLDVRELGVDLLSVAGHKLYAPKGVGALYVRRGTPMVPFVLGAGHERGLRPGTENVAAIVGLGMACEIAGSDMETVAARVAALRDDLWQRLEAAVPGVMLNGHRTLRLPNTLNVRFPSRLRQHNSGGRPGNCRLHGLGLPRRGRKRFGRHSRNGHRCRRRDRFDSAHARSGHDCCRHGGGGRCACSILAHRLEFVTTGRSVVLRSMHGRSAETSGQVAPGSGIQDTAEALAAQLTARECTAGAGSAANDDPSVRIKDLGARGQILQGNVQAPRSMSGGEFARRTHVHHLGPFLQQRGDSPSRKE